jgi:hypothetical protein
MLGQLLSQQSSQARGVFSLLLAIPQIVRHPVIHQVGATRDWLQEATTPNYG